MRAWLPAICSTAIVAPFLWSHDLRAQEVLTATAAAAAPTATASSAAATTSATVGSVAATTVGALAPPAATPASPNSGLAAQTSFDRGGDDDYMHRYLPAKDSLEAGAFLGTLFISDKNSLRGKATNDNGALALRPYTEFKQPAPEFGARIGYFPFTFLGGEAEALVAAGSAKEGTGTTLLAGRASVIAQVPNWSIVPFAMGGVGFWSTFSSYSGNDFDPAFHFGGGLKVAASEGLDVRVDVRDNLTNGRPRGDIPNSMEITAGATWVPGREKSAPPDPDGDGFVGEHDRCPNEPGVAPDGCPVRDRDGDQVVDSDDQCPDQAGPAPTGCPPADMDSDGIPDAQDQCPNEPGVAPFGCPVDSDHDGVPDKADQCPSVPGPAPGGCPLDSDGDGILDKDDKCPNQPETKNGFEDSDGCPDELPKAVQKFTGVIGGIEFDSDRDSIRKPSYKVLDEAAKILSEYPALRVEVTGHTDDTGAHDHNLALSQARAEAVKEYLVAHGVPSDRISTRGAGPDEPLVQGKTKQARQKNRRIEFHIVQ
jgi:outer membrane protein OmpA-like peptidoglycan-associated protein